MIKAISHSKKGRGKLNVRLVYSCNMWLHMN